MSIICAICQDALERSNDIFVTPCGHVFHFPCLIQWLEKVHNCPQCRQKVNREKILRVYFNYCNTESIKEDSFTLQQKIDNLSFQIKLKEKEFSNCREEIVVLKRQNSGLRDEVKKTENEIVHKNSVIHALKEQSSFFKQKCQDYDAVLENKIKLESKLQTYENVKRLLCATTDDVDKMIKQTVDIRSLSTYACTMKRELSMSLNQRKELRTTVKRLQQELQAMKMKKNSDDEEHLKELYQLEEALTLCQSKNDALQKIINDMESNSKNSVESSESGSRKRESKSETDEALPKKIKQTLEKKSSKDNDDSDIILVSPDVRKTKENEENSPYLPTKSKSILALKEHVSQRSGFSISSKRNFISSKSKSESALKSSREKDSSVVFDGFGGHTKIESFPLPKTSPSKVKRSANDSSRNKKIKLELNGNKQLDDFIINLT